MRFGKFPAHSVQLHDAGKTFPIKREELIGRIADAVPRLSRRAQTCQRTQKERIHAQIRVAIDDLPCP